jgi:hypothetical protein
MLANVAIPSAGPSYPQTLPVSAKVLFGFSRNRSMTWITVDK